MDFFRVQAKRDPGHLVVMFLKRAPSAKEVGALIRGPPRRRGKESVPLFCFNGQSGDTLLIMDKPSRVAPQLGDFEKVGAGSRGPNALRMLPKRYRGFVRQRYNLPFAKIMRISTKMSDCGLYINRSFASVSYSLRQPDDPRICGCIGMWATLSKQTDVKAGPFQ